MKGQTRGDRTRQLIIDETIRCVRDEGFAAISASHIAERAGVTWGVIQYHFGDRSAVLMAVVDHGYELLREAIDDVEVTGRSPRERVHAVVDAGGRPSAIRPPLPHSRSSSPPEPAVSRGSKSTLPTSAEQLARLGRALDPARSGTKASGTRQPVVGHLRGLALAQMVVREPLGLHSRAPCAR